MELSSKSKSRKKYQKLELARQCFSWKFISNGWSPWNFVRFGMVTFEMLVYSLPETTQSCPWTVQPEIAPRPEMNHRLQHHWKKIRGLWCLVSGRASFSGFFFGCSKHGPKMGAICWGKDFSLVGTLEFRRFFFLLQFGEVFSQVQERVVGFWFFPSGDVVVGDGRNCCRDRGEVIIREQFLLTSEEICRVGWAQFVRLKKRRKQVEIA